MRGLRKQARKGQLTAREREDLLDQEAMFRKARRANAPAYGAGLLGAGALLGTPAGQSILSNIAGGVQGLRAQAQDARENRKSIEEEFAQDRALRAAETNQELEALANMNRQESARAEAEQTAAGEPIAQGDLTTPDEPATPDVPRDPYAEGRAAFEAVQPELEKLRAEERQRELAASMNEGRYGGGYIDQINDIFEASKNGAVVTVPEYDDNGNVIGEKEVRMDFESTADDMLDALGAKGGGPGFGSYNADEVEAMMEAARARAEGQMSPIRSLPASLLERDPLRRSGPLGEKYDAQQAFEAAQPELARLRGEEKARDRGFDSYQDMLDEYNKIISEGDEVAKQQGFNSALDRVNFYDNFYREGRDEEMSQQAQDRIDNMPRDPRIERARDLGSRTRVQAIGGRTPQMQDFVNKIARKYGIK